MREFKNVFLKILSLVTVASALGCELSKDELQIFLASKSANETTTTFPESVALDQASTYTENSLPQFALGTSVASKQNQRCRDRLVT